MARNQDGTFTKGASGNPRGRPRKAPNTIEVPSEALISAHRTDSWFSPETGIGTHAHDRRMSHRPRTVNLSYQDCITIMSTDDLGRRALQDPVEDAFRPGYSIETREQGDFDELKEDVLERAEELGVDEYLTRAVVMERGLGGCALLMGINDHRPLSSPVDETAARGLDWLNILEPIELTPYTFYDKPSDGPNYGRPKLYQLTGFTSASAGLGANLGDDRLPPSDHLIHESRLIVFHGIRVSRYQWANNTLGRLWGESMIASFYEALRDLNVGYSAAAILATEIGQPIISIPNLMTMVATKPKELLERMQAIQRGRSSARVVLLDEKEKLQLTDGDHLKSVPDLLNALAIRFAASIPMPLSRLMGQAPKALGNENDSETDFYHADVKNLWRTKIVKPLKRVLGYIMKGERTYKVPKRWSIKQKDLNQLDDVQRAQAHLTQARTDSMYIKAGVVKPDEIRKCRFVNGYSFDTVVDPNSKAPGFVTVPPNGTPGSPHNPTPGAAGPAALNAHPVGGYTRRNPVSKGTEPAAKQGGDVTPSERGNAKKDAQSELEYTLARIAQLEADGSFEKYPSLRGLMEQLAQIAREELAEHEAEMCEPQECLAGDHPEEPGEDPEEPGEDPEEEFCVPPGTGPGDGPGEMVKFAGFDIVVENLVGSTRAWGDPDGVHGETTMKYAYGYILGSTGQDGDAVDVYLGPEENSKWVFVVHQQMAPDFIDFDEDKVMLGFADAASATEAYLGQYDDPRFFGGMTQMPLEKFRQKVLTQAGKMTA